MKKTPGHPARGLCLTGLLILISGVALAFLLREESSIIQQQERFRLTLLLTVTAAGICFIAATARWWMKH